MEKSPGPSPFSSPIWIEGRIKSAAQAVLTSRIEIAVESKRIKNTRRIISFLDLMILFTFLWGGKIGEPG